MALFSKIRFLQCACAEWVSIREASLPTSRISLSGNSLTIAHVVAVSLMNIAVDLEIPPDARQSMAASVNVLAEQLAAGKVVYGVNTGFGGSADTRTRNHPRLQSALIQHLNVGILVPADRGGFGRVARGFTDLAMLLRRHALPPAVVRAMMLIRSNSLVRGHSAVRVEIVEALLKLISAHMTPVVPLRGSISASGDLAPLSYVAGLLEGNPDIDVNICLPLTEAPADEPPPILPADQALSYIGLKPIRLQAKEGLGITNGTAASCAAAALAVYSSNQLAVWAQLLTAMGTEALAGTAHNYDPFISYARPHVGQAEAAATIRLFLDGSTLTHKPAGPANAGLAQDRYALRTAPQWIGPQLEDLALARLQICIELNSSTDNPLIDAGSGGGPAGTIHHGGNFQAMAVTSAMEKTLTALQNLGRLLFAQSTELVDNKRNCGLPPNLSADDPSTSFICKGFDVNMAAYQAELAYLARPVSSHVQAAEMGNQSVNSMALVAARYALEACEILSLMVATYIFVLCQALDLRCIQRHFHLTVARQLWELGMKTFGAGLCIDGVGLDCSKLDSMMAAAVKSMLYFWDELSHLDLAERGAATAASAMGSLIAALATTAKATATDFPNSTALLSFQREASQTMVATYDATRALFMREPSRTSALLGPGSRIVYEFVRRDLGIPMSRGVEDHPTLAAEQAANRPRDAGSPPERLRTLGTKASEIYLALRDGRMFDRVVVFCEEKQPWADQEKA